MSPRYRLSPEDYRPEFGAGWRCVEVEKLRARSCARHRTREHCALSVMLTVSQLSKSSLLLEVRFGESGIRRVVVSNRSESRWSDLDWALGLASLARATSGHGRPFPDALCTDNLQSSDRYR